LLAKTFAPSSNLEYLLVQLIEEVKLTNIKLDSLIKQTNSKPKKENKKIPNKKQTAQLSPDVLSLISLPVHLRKTVMALYKLEKATADELSAETNRQRAVESASANQLARMGYLKKKREGHKVYFYIEQETGESR
jgi:hypothetical protein